MWITKSSLHASLAMLAIASIAMLTAGSAFALSYPPFVEFSRPELKLPYSPPLTGITAGQQVVIVTTVAHVYSDQDLDLIALVEVRDGDGVTKYLAWQSGKLQVGGQMEIGVSWVPDRSGYYEIRTFAVTNNWDSPQVLSGVKSSEVEIGQQKGAASYQLSAGNKTFEVQYAFSGDVRITNMTMITKSLAIVAAVDIGEDSTLEVHLPNEMLKEFEVASDMHYCVGNEFAIFVDGKDAAFVSEISDSEEILTLSVEKDVEKIEIIGSDLLMWPTRCPV